MRLCLLLALFAPDLQEVRPMLLRISEEAQRFYDRAPKLLSEETFRQRALKPPRRFRMRGQTGPPTPVYRTKQVISEYSLAVFEGNLHEFRQVVTVDGQQIKSAPDARRALSLGLHSTSDRTRKHMLEDFHKYGLEGAATDFAPLLLLFMAPHLEHYRFTQTGSRMVGAEQVNILSYEQLSGDQSFLVFAGRNTIREPLHGEIFVRRSDNVPIRVTMIAERTQGSHHLRDEAAVDYSPSTHGCLTPVSAVYRGYADQILLVEDEFHYSPFKMFEADTDIQFKPLPETTPK